MSKNNLKIINARENNLKEVGLEIKHDCLTVVTGYSGSGKSSLAFDTVYAEGQRRYIETFSSYTRQFFDKVKKPDCDKIENVRPAIAIQQRTKISNSRSTVGSITNINDYLKLFWLHLSKPFCPKCEKELSAWNSNKLLKLIENSDETILVCGELIPEAKQLKNEIKRLQILGYSRYYDQTENKVVNLDDLKKLSHEKLLVVVDRIVPAKSAKTRIKDSLDQAIALSNKNCVLINNDKISAYPLILSCCDIDYELSSAVPGLFTYSSPIGACKTCRGFGNILDVDPKLVVSDASLSIEDGAIDKLASLTTSLGSTSRIFPKPRQVLQAPIGLL